MNLPFFRFTFFLLMSLTLPLTATAQVVDIPDPNLRAAIENKLGKAPGTPIAPAEMVTLTHLEARNANISDLTGLEGATNLKSLRLGGNSISDIAPVTSLTNLKVLSLWANSISDISPVEALTNLTELNLSGNLISDISPVADLNQLTWLHLQSNRISDIAALASLTNLTALRLDRNSISDISVLSRLILTELRLDRNSLTDLKIDPVDGTAARSQQPYRPLTLGSKYRIEEWRHGWCSRESPELHIDKDPHPNPPKQRGYNKV